MEDCTEAMWRLRLSFRPGKVDIDTKLLGLAIDDNKYFGNIPPIDIEFPTLENVALVERYIPLERAIPSIPSSPVITAESPLTDEF